MRTYLGIRTYQWTLTAWPVTISLLDRTVPSVDLLTCAILGDEVRGVELDAGLCVDKPMSTTGTDHNSRRSLRRLVSSVGVRTVTVKGQSQPRLLRCELDERGRGRFGEDEPADDIRRSEIFLADADWGGGRV
jgi:hypothetical protein